MGQRAHLRVQSLNEQDRYLHRLAANIRSDSMYINASIAEPGSDDNISFLISGMRDLSDFRAKENGHDIMPEVKQDIFLIAAISTKLFLISYF